MLRDIMDRSRVPTYGVTREKKNCSFQKLIHFPQVKTNGNLQLEKDFQVPKRGKKTKQNIR